MGLLLGAACLLGWVVVCCFVGFLVLGGSFYLCSGFFFALLFLLQFFGCVVLLFQYGLFLVYVLFLLFFFVFLGRSVFVLLL